MTSTINWQAYHQKLAALNTFVRSGQVTQVIGLTIEAQGLRAQIGELCYINSKETPAPSPPK
jgi:flagellar biosynthesis/type III secretory pathway ATPase